MRGIHTCCPSPVSTINITQNVVEMDGTRAFWVQDRYVGSDYSIVNGFTLTYVPYARSQLSLLLNTAQMIQGVDFTVSASKVFLTFTPVATDNIVIRYFALTDSTSSILADSTLATGMMIGYGGSGTQDGWLEMDGSATHSGTGDNLALFNWLAIGTRSTDYCDAYVAGVGGTFKLKLVQTPYYNGTTLVTGKTLIKL